MSADTEIMRARLRKTGEEYVIRELNQNDIFELYGLHKTILSNLRQGQECFIHHKTVKDFLGMINNPNQIMLGTFVDNRLIGYSSANLLNQNNIDEVLPGFNLNYEPEKIVVLEQASVNPAYRGNNLASIMNACRQKMAETQYGRQYAVMMVDIHNYFSYRNGLRNGMAITQASIDPDDGGQIVYLAKEFGRQPEFHSNRPQLKIGYDAMNLDTVAGALQKGYVAHGFDDEQRQVIFSHTNSFDFRHKMSQSDNGYETYRQLAGQER